MENLPLYNSIGLVVAVAVLWWRMKVVETEVKSLREMKHDMNNVKGRIDAFLAIFGDVFEVKPRERGRG